MMIETLPQRPITADVRLPGDVAAAFAAFRADLAGRSRIVWGEHCSECAYPACYAHCAFYTPRSDFNCRRFEAGFEPVAGDRALHRVRFRKWGKLEGRGPAPITPISTALALDRRDALASGLIASAPAPSAVKQNLAWRWNSRKRKGVGRPVAPTDLFIVEAWACDGQRRPFTLTILNAQDHDGRMFQARFEVGGAYGRLAVPAAEIALQVDLDAPYLVQIEPVGEAEGVQVVFGVCDFVTLRAATSGPSAASPLPSAKPAKVVVWDLDETLWTGVLVEDGLEGVRLRPEAVAAIKMLDERGVLQSVASKNNPAEALAALSAFGLADYFLHPQIHWNPKSGSLAALAGALNLSLDSFVFIDDQPFERAEVEAAHPAVRTLPHTAAATLADHPWFDLPVTIESRRRRALYREEAHRTEAYETAGSDYAGFLRASEIKLAIDRLAPDDVERVFELSQRTNQLNFTGRKYHRDEVRALLASKTGDVGLCLRCSDRFGDYGLIGFAVVDCAKGRVSELFMSCRVQRKRVEHAFFAWLGWGMAQRGATDMGVAYAATGRNGAALDMLQALGFAPSDAVDGLWTRPAAAAVDESDIVAIIARSAAKAA
jgi:FkbH-like protein